MNTSVQLIGALNPMGDSIGFATPIFETDRGDKCFQHCEVSGRISGFIEAAIGDENIMRVGGGHYSVGDEAVFGFYISREEIWLKTRKALCASLNKCLVKKGDLFYQKPFLLIEIGRFLRHNELILEAIEIAFLEMAGLKRDMNLVSFLQLIGERPESYCQLKFEKFYVERNAFNKLFGGVCACEKLISRCKEALEYARGRGDKSTQEEFLENLGFLYSAQARYIDSLEHYQEQLQIVREKGSKYREMKTQGNLGNLCNVMGQHTLAFEHYERAMEIARVIGGGLEKDGILPESLMNVFFSLNNVVYCDKKGVARKGKRRGRDKGKGSGKVKWFNNSKGYGFITTDAGADIFVHPGAFQSHGYVPLEETEYVQFEIKHDFKDELARSSRKSKTQ